MDDADRAQDRAELERQAGVRHQQNQATLNARPAPRGYCLNLNCCEEFPAGDQRIFCNDKCSAQAARRK
jgi:hypothetical protein